MEQEKSAIELINGAIREMIPGRYDNSQINSLIKIFDIIITKKKVDPSWQIPESNDKKRKTPKENEFQRLWMQ
jgi:hypothetical protein